MAHDCIIYTTEPVAKLRQEAAVAKRYLERSKGRDTFNIDIRKIKIPNSVVTKTDANGKVRLDWLWFKSRFFTNGMDRVGFHFAPAMRKKWGLTLTINGSSFSDKDGGFFYLAAADKRAKWYKDLTEFTRLVIHENCHLDAAETGSPLDVELWEDLHLIHEMPALFNFEKSSGPIRPIPEQYWRAVSQVFMEPSSHYKSGVHPGTDFRCPVGVPVVAPCDGEIYYVAKDHPSLGNAAYFRFDRAGKTYYARFLHLSSVASLGNYKQGELLGKTGNTGDSTGPHLHLDIWVTSIDVNLIRTKQGVQTYLVDPISFFARP